MLVSTLIPVGPGSDPKWLKEAVTSTLDQVGCDHELVMFFDGCDPDLMLQCDDARIVKEYSTTNNGVAYALNRCLLHATGAVCARLDADDRSLPGRYLVQLDLLQDHDIVGSAITWNPGCNYPPPDCSDVMGLLRRGKVPVFHPTMMFRRNRVVDVCAWPWSEEYPHAEDFAFHCQMTTAGLRYANSPEVLVNYRSHPGQVSVRHADIQRASTQKCIERMLGD